MSETEQPFPAEAPREETPLEPEAERRERIKLHRAEMYVSLAQDERFQQFMNELEAKKSRIRSDQAGVLLDPHINAEQLLKQAQYDRGWIDALTYPEQIIRACQAYLSGIENVEPEPEPDDDEGSLW